MLGAVSPIVPSYLDITNWAYQNLASIEDRLRKLDLLESKPPSAFFSGLDATSELADDYVAFMERGVPFLNIVPEKMQKNESSLEDIRIIDEPTTRDWAKIVTGFTLEWMDMMEVWHDEPR